MNIEVNVFFVLLAACWLLDVIFWRPRIDRRLNDLQFRVERLLLHIGYDPDIRSPVTEDVARLARTPGAKIAAIKEYRRQTGAGLKEAKDEVERLMRTTPSSDR